MLRVLKERQIGLYQSLRSPQGFDPQTTHAVFAFLFSRRPEATSDIGIRRLAYLMRSLLAVFVVGAVVFLFLLQRVVATQPY